MDIFLLMKLVRLRSELDLINTSAPRLTKVYTVVYAKTRLRRTKSSAVNLAAVTIRNVVFVLAELGSDLQKLKDELVARLCTV